MKKIAYSIIVITMIATTGISGFISSTVAKPPSGWPTYNPLRLNFTWSPQPSYYGEEVTFVGTVTNGTPPYNFTWKWDDMTLNTYDNNNMQGITTKTHFFYLGDDPRDYNVNLSVKDSSNPTQFSTYRIKIVSIDVLYDIWISYINTEYTLYSHSDPYIKVNLDVTNSVNFYMCPKYKVELEIYEIVLGIPIPTGICAEQWGYDLDDGHGNSWNLNMQNPGFSNFWYKVRAEITYAPYDDGTWHNIQWTDSFFVK